MRIIQTPKGPAMRYALKAIQTNAGATPHQLTADKYLRNRFHVRTRSQCRTNFPAPVVRLKLERIEVD